MAKQLYDYWFVQFDFPNEEGKPYKSSGGKMVWNEKLKREIPAGWNVKSIFNELSVQYGYPFSTDQFTEEQTNVPVVRIRDILDNSISAYSHEGTDDKYRLNEGDLLVGMDGNFHMNYWIDNTAYLNQRSVRLRATERSTVSVVQARYDIAPYIKAKELRAKGSTVGHLSDKDLKELYVIVGTSNKLREAFDSLLNRIIANRKENLLLIKQRDELLPLLMNGKVSVNYHLANKNNVVNTLFRAKLLTLYKIGLHMSENLKLWDIIDSFISGDWGNEEESPEAPCCVSCIRGADIVPICNSDFDNIPIRYISNRSFTTHCLQEGDIIVEKSGGSPTQSTGRVVYISKELLAAKHDIVCSNFCVAFRVKPEWNSFYIYYYLRNVYNAGVFFNFEGKTSGIKNLDIETAFRAIPIKAIAMESQISIATAISCLDKKIALNRAINDNLEAMAKQLYDYWFVQFDFPNEEGKPYKSSGGKMVWNDKLKREIPEGWYADNICRIADILSGGTPSKQIDSYWQNGNIPFFGPTDYAGAIFQLNTAEHITSDGLKHCASSLFEEGVVIITARGSIGKLVIVGTPMAMNQSCYAFRSRNNEFEYLYFLTAQLIEHLKAKGSGSVFKSIITTDIENSILSIADETTITLFTSTIRPLMSAIKENTKQIEVLTKQRDELLPLLMNGQVSVNYHLSDD